MKEECNCWIGFIHQSDRDERIYLNDYIKICNREAEHSRIMNEYVSEKKLDSVELKWLGSEALEYIDKRRGFSKLFNYCPYCGGKINWKVLRKALTEAKA